MRLWLLLFVTACASCVTQDDPPYGDPGAIGGKKFRDEGASSGTTPAGDGGSSGGTTGPFPAAYDAANPPAPTEPTDAMHKRVANGVAIAPTTACLTCHGTAATTATNKWAAAGWAAMAPGAQTGLDKGEVVIVDGAKVIGPVKTSPDGYFWIPVAQGTVGPQASTAIRNSAGMMSAMSQKLGGNGDCNNTTCHGGGAGPVDFKP